MVIHQQCDVGCRPVSLLPARQMPNRPASGTTTVAHDAGSRHLDLLLRAGTTLPSWGLHLICELSSRISHLVDLIYSIRRHLKLRAFRICPLVNLVHLIYLIYLRRILISDGQLVHLIFPVAI